MVITRIIRKLHGNIGAKEIQQFIKSSESHFDGVLKKVKIVKAGDGSCLAELKVDEEHTNPMGGLHGGMSATLVDCITTYALFTHKGAFMVPSVSVDIHMSYMKGATVGDDIIIDANTVRAGKTLAFLKCDIKNKATGDILVRGSHTKFVIRPKE